MTANPNISAKKRVAIIGAGISGLSSAYYLHHDFDVTIFERNDYLGGHTDTHSFTLEGKEVRVDSGFIIFCPQYYPHFTKMLTELDVEAQPTNMSFSAFNPETDTVYNATSPNKLFCDRRNLLRPRFWRMLLDIVRFYRRSVEVLDNPMFDNVSTADYLASKKYGDGFRDDHLLPMISALWSTNPQKVTEFPIQHLVDFFQRHGLMKIVARPQWLVVKNGSASYVEALQKKLNCEWVLNSRINSVKREANRVYLKTDNNHQRTFDAVIFACHADQALALLEDASPQEQSILSQMPFEKNHVVVHTDDSIMHPNKRSWASWNTEVPTTKNPISLDCCTANYWMNSLQSLPIETNVFTTLNGHKRIDPDCILAERYYTHPIFDQASVSAQKRRDEINGVNNSYFVGAYWGWGFHEDGARSAFESCEQLKRTFAQSVQRAAA